MKQRTAFTLLFIFVALFALGEIRTAVSGQQNRPPAPQGLSFVFREVEPVIRRESRVPPMLPNVLPYVSKSSPIHAVLQSANNSGYDILLANELPCEGQNWCLYGSVRGAVAPFIHTLDGVRQKPEPVKLSKGIEGSFIKAECASYCTQAYVEWRHDGCYYSIGMKAGERNQLLEMANSAITAVR